MRHSLQREPSAGPWLDTVDRGCAALVIGMFLVYVLDRFFNSKCDNTGPGQQHQPKPASRGTAVV